MTLKKEHAETLAALADAILNGADMRLTEAWPRIELFMREIGIAEPREAIAAAREALR